jgi:subtilase family serine protease
MVSMPQIVTAEEYVVRHHLGDVISQSFTATEQAIGSSGIHSLRGAYLAAYSGRVTVLAGSGDSGVTGFESNQQSYYTHRVTSWPASDPLVTAVGGTRLDLDACQNWPAWPAAKPAWPVLMSAVPGAYRPPSRSRSACV